MTPRLMGAMPQGRGGRAAVDGGPAPLVLTAAHEPALIAYETRASWRSCARSWISRW